MLISYIQSIMMIILEVICCKIFFESFCDSSGENRKYKSKRTISSTLTNICRSHG